MVHSMGGLILESGVKTVLAPRSLWRADSLPRGQNAVNTALGVQLGLRTTLSQMNGFLQQSVHPREAFDLMALDG